MKVGPALALLMLGACSGGQPRDDAAQPQDLESAAIERGLVRDPRDTELTGLYARDTDRICIVPAKAGYRIGAYVDYGEGITCSGAGSVTRVGEALHIRLGDGEKCSFEARFDGDHIRFPGALPDGCRAFCARRAAFSGLEVSRLSESISEARAMRDAAGRRLCGE